MASGRRECPYCRVPLVRIQSRQKDTLGQWFLKCPFNIKVRIHDILGITCLLVALNLSNLMQGDPSTCGFIRSEAEYESLEAHQRRSEAAAGDCCAQLKQELEELKEKLDSVVAELWKQKSEQELESRKMQIVIDSSVVVPLLVGLVGVMFGVVVSGMWN